MPPVALTALLFEHGYVRAYVAWLTTPGHDNKTARTVAVREGETINAPALAAIFEQIIANNRAGGWRKFKRESC